jgi:hypothetical protein
VGVGVRVVSAGAGVGIGVCAGCSMTAGAAQALKSKATIITDMSKIRFIFLSFL